MSLELKITYVDHSDRALLVRRVAVFEGDEIALPFVPSVEIDGCEMTMYGQNQVLFLIKQIQISVKEMD